MDRILPIQRPKIRDIPSFTARCTRERGLFAFLQQGHWQIADEDEWPYILFTERYVFEIDPLAFGEENQWRIPYYRFESARHLDWLRTWARYYYPREDEQQLPWREVAARGLTKADVLG